VEFISQKLSFIKIIIFGEQTALALLDIDLPFNVEFNLSYIFYERCVSSVVKNCPFLKLVVLIVPVENLRIFITVDTYPIIFPIYYGTFIKVIVRVTDLCVVWVLQTCVSSFDSHSVWELEEQLALVLLPPTEWSDVLHTF